MGVGYLHPEDSELPPPTWAAPQKDPLRSSPPRRWPANPHVHVVSSRLQTRLEDGVNLPKLSVS